MPVPLKKHKKNSFLGVLVVLVGRVGHQSWEPGAPSPRLFVDESTPSRRPSANQPAIIPAMGPSGVTSWSSTQILKHRYLSKPIKTHQTTKPINISTDCINKTQITSCHIYQHPSTWLVATHLRSDRLAATGPIGFNIQALPQLFRHMIHFPWDIEWSWYIIYI